MTVFLLLQKTNLIKSDRFNFPIFVNSRVGLLSKCYFVRCKISYSSERAFCVTRTEHMGKLKSKFAKFLFILRSQISIIPTECRKYAKKILRWGVRESETFLDFQVIKVINFIIIRT